MYFGTTHRRLTRSRRTPSGNCRIDSGALSLATGLNACPNAEIANRERTTRPRIRAFLADLPNGKSALSALFSLDSNWDRLYFTNSPKRGRQLGNNPADRRSELGEKR